MIWTFHEPGVIPGIPGSFANCRVTVSDDGTYDIQPLPRPADAPPVTSPEQEEQQEEEAKDATDTDRS